MSNPERGALIGLIMSYMQACPWINGWLRAVGIMEDSGSSACYDRAWAYVNTCACGCRFTALFRITESQQHCTHFSSAWAITVKIVSSFHPHQHYHPFLGSRNQTVFARLFWRCTLKTEIFTARVESLTWPGRVSNDSYKQASSIPWRAGLIRLYVVYWDVY